ncbi:MAG: hypothetical protein K8J31_15725 [Anaerolineae bacterium]|nr:hypothetical protein [Anaerolineae bacterium]
MKMKMLIPRLYWGLMHLYPAALRAEFAREMQAVFETAWTQANQRGDALAFCARELGSLLWEAGRTHWVITLNPTGPIEQARAITRMASLLLSLFYLKVTLGGTETTMLLLNGILLAGVLAAWRWERQGVIVMLISALLAGFLLAFSLTHIPGYPALLWLAMIPAVLYPLPFVLFGGMLTVLSRVSAARQMA